MVRIVGDVFGLLYFATELASLVAVTDILIRLRYGIAMAVAPVATVAVFTLAFQVLAVTTMPHLPFFGFGFVAAVKPALALVPPIFVVLIALSPRISPPPPPLSGGK
jgi:hypothetical protein